MNAARRRRVMIAIKTLWARRVDAVGVLWERCVYAITCKFDIFRLYFGATPQRADMFSFGVTRALQTVENFGTYEYLEIKPALINSDKINWVTDWVVWILRKDAEDKMSRVFMSNNAKSEGIFLSGKLLDCRLGDCKFDPAHSN